MNINESVGLGFVLVAIYSAQKPTQDQQIMSKIIVAAVICSLCVAIQAASLPVNDATTMFVSDLTTYLRENPELEVIGELERSGSNRIPIRYTLGKRVAGKCDLASRHYLDVTRCALIGC